MSDRQYDNVDRFPIERARPSQVEPFRPFYAAQMQGRQPRPREWLVDGVIARRTVLLFAGPPKIGKSLLLQQMFTGLATGQAWLGRQTVQSRCFGLFCEDEQDELERRQCDVNSHYGVEPADFETEYSWESRINKDAVLVQFNRDNPVWTPLWTQMVEFCRDTGVKVIGIDTAAAVFLGNENWRSHTTVFLRALQRLATQIDGAVILNAHPSRNNPNSYSGTTAWLASVRSAMSLGRPQGWDPDNDNDPQRHVRVLRGLGTNYFSPAGLHAERLEFDHGVLVPSDPETRHSGRSGPLDSVQRADLRYRMLMGLKKVIQNGGKVHADMDNNNSMPKRAKRSTDATINRISLNDLNLAQEEMLDQGMVTRVRVDRFILVRPHDGPYYDREEPWLPVPSPEQQRREAADD